MKHGCHAIWFERHPNPSPVFPDCALAVVGQIDKSEFISNLPAAIAKARWRSKPFESFEHFRSRITRDLESEGTHGVLVSVYEHGSHFVRNSAGSAATYSQKVNYDATTTA